MWAIAFPDKSFNPTLVRLRPFHASQEIALLDRFNPTLVRLRPPRGLRPRTPTAVFQSHAGSIEALAPPLANRLVHIEVSIPRWFD